MSAPRLPLMLVSFLLVAGLGLAWLLALDAAGRSDHSVTEHALAPAAAGDSSSTRAAPARDHAPASGSEVALNEDVTSPWVSGATLVYEGYGDLHALAEVNLEAAQSGDAEAQYAMFIALNTCNSTLLQVESIDALREKLERTLRNTNDTDQQRALKASFAACAGFAGEDMAAYGDPADWLMRAANQGHPLAGMHYAERLHSAARRRDPDLRDEVRRYFLTGIASGRVEALPLVTSWVSRESGLSGAELIFFSRAVLMLTCQRGYPCSPGTRWWDTRRQWAGRSADSAEDLLLMQFNAEGQARTREIAAQMAAAIDEGRYSDLLDPPPDSGQ